MLSKGNLIQWTASICFVLIQVTGFSQFSYQPKRTNLTIKEIPNHGWEFYDLTGTKKIAQVEGNNLFVQIQGDEMKIYEVSLQLWNIQTEPKFLDAIKISFTSFPYPEDQARFDYFSSFWLSGEGDHIRLFFRPHSIKVVNNSGIERTYSNHNIGNHIFINGNKKAKITNTSNLFMIAPEGNIFEIDPNKKIWRFILKNRTLTPWTSDPPTEKMVFQIFRKQDFKKVIPIGIKEDKFWFQVINHQNKMGLASLTNDYFQITYDVPPMFDFISPSLLNDFHLVYENKKLAVLFFSGDETRKEFNTLFTKANQILSANGSLSRPSNLKSDYQSFTIVKNEQTFSNKDFISTTNFSLKIIDSERVLYNETDTSNNLFYSGLYHIPQNQWFITPTKKHLTSYPNANLETQFANNSLPESYTVYTRNGLKLHENVSDFSSVEFKQLCSQVTDLSIDTLQQITEFGIPTFKFQVEEKWGVLQVNKSDFQVLVTPSYSRIEQFGKNESLLLINEQNFDWYGKNYSINSEDYLFLHSLDDIYLDSNNGMVEFSNLVNAFTFKHYQVINNQKNAMAFRELHKPPIIEAKEIIPKGDLLWIISAKKHTLVNSKLKEIKTSSFDSVLYDSVQIVWFDTKTNKISEHFHGKEFSFFPVQGSFYQGKPNKDLLNYEVVYYHKKHLIGKKNGNWIILNPNDHKDSFAIKTSLLEACLFVNSMTKNTH